MSITNNSMLISAMMIMPGNAGSARLVCIIFYIIIFSKYDILYSL